MSRRPSVLIVVVLGALLASCAPAPEARPAQAPAASAPNAQPAQQSRTLVAAHRYEPANLLPKVLQSNGPLNTTRLFNAALTLIDDQGVTRPYLAEALPQLNTDSWRVFPDGRMETTYRLRENLTWQDGTPLTAADFAFALSVYKTPGLAIFISTPQDVIEEVTAPDPRTVVVRWRVPNAAGGSLTFEELDPLPRHLVEPLFADLTEGRISSESFLSNAFWTTDYIGAGPYKMDRWEPGVQLQGTAFAGHALGKAKIDRFVVRFFIDENQTLAAILAGGAVDYACCNTLRFAQLLPLKRDFDGPGRGTSVATLGTAVFLFLQQRPEYVGHEGLLDLRVRRALAHAIDRPALNEGVFDGLSVTTETPVPPTAPFYAELDRTMTKYPLDLNRAAELMSQAGYTKDREGFFANAQGRRFHIDFTVQSASEIERMQTILSDSWRRAGFEVRQNVMAPQLFTQQETRHTLPGLGYAFFTTGEDSYRTSQIGTAANRWAGSNRSGWISPDYDRAWEAANSTLDMTERGRHIAQMMALVSDQLPGYALYFSQTVRSWSSAVQGPPPTEAAGFGRSIRPTTNYYNVYEWTMR